MVGTSQVSSGAWLPAVCQLLCGRSRRGGVCVFARTPHEGSHIADMWLAICAPSCVRDGRMPCSGNISGERVALVLCVCHGIKYPGTVPVQYRPCCDARTPDRQFDGRVVSDYLCSRFATNATIRTVSAHIAYAYDVHVGRDSSVRPL